MSIKSTLLVLFACITVLNCEVVETKGLTTDFLIDNIVNPMLQGINNNALNFLMQQLLGGLIGKRSIEDVVSQIQVAINNNKDKIQQAINGIIASLHNIASLFLGPSSKGLTTDFLIDNIVNPMLQGINNNALNYLLQQLLGGLIGKK